MFVFVVSIRLSHYLVSGQALTPKEAVIMTSDLSKNITTLHKIGMTASAIDPEHIYVEQDNTVSTQYVPK